MSRKIRVAELFAGVGGFRLGLDGYKSDEFSLPAAGPFKTVWANQWEPPGTPGRQFAAKCYTERFGEVVNEDIAVVLDKAEAGEIEIPDVDMVVGGFPCQDYSVAKPLSQAAGIDGKKGVLWWQIVRFLQLKNPRLVLLENVDRLLKSPATQRGRDFAIMLSCFYRMGYSVQWRVINGADYGGAQRRRRVYIFAQKDVEFTDLEKELTGGVLAKAFPIQPELEGLSAFDISDDPYKETQEFGIGKKVSPFQTGGVMSGGHVLTAKVAPKYSGKQITLGDVLEPEDSVPEAYFVPEEKLEGWKYQKGAKREPRVNAQGFEYFYSEGAMAFPDPLDKPARTILTGESGVSPSRFKHVVLTESGRHRRLVPAELEALQGFPKGWTSMLTDSQRAFCMGNALMVMIPHRIGKQIAKLK